MDTEYIEQIKKKRCIKNAKEAESWIKHNNWLIEQHKKSIYYAYEATQHGADRHLIAYEVERLGGYISECLKENAALEIIRKQYGSD